MCICSSWYYSPIVVIFIMTHVTGTATTTPPMTVVCTDTLTTTVTVVTVSSSVGLPQAPGQNNDILPLPLMAIDMTDVAALQQQSKAQLGSRGQHACCQSGWYQLWHGSSKGGFSFRVNHPTDILCYSAAFLFSGSDVVKV